MSVVENKLRINVYLARCGAASRRGADLMIVSGRVRVNGGVVSQLGLMVDLDNDIVELDGNKIDQLEKKVYYAVYKPIGYTSTVEDCHAEKTVIDLFPATERLFPVGRLDKDSEGLMIVTNDGDFAYRLTHPKHEVSKVYLVTVRGKISELKLQKLRDGVELDDEMTAPALVKIVERTKDGAVLEFKIHEGMKRQIRRMCAEVNFFVLKLVRIKIGSLELGKLGPGSYRILKQIEVQ